MKLTEVNQYANLKLQGPIKCSISKLQRPTMLIKVLFPKIIEYWQNYFKMR